MNTSPVSRPASAGIRPARLLRRILAIATLLYGSSLALAQAPQHYKPIYNNSLQGNWVDASWSVNTNFSAAAPQGRTGNAIEVSTSEGWGAFSLYDGWNRPYDNFFNESATIEFEIYFDSGSQNNEALTFHLWESGNADTPRVIDLIPNWAGMTDAQRYGRWFHVRVALASLHPDFAGFMRIAVRNGSASGGQHFRLADVKIGWNDDLTPPTATLGTVALDYNQLTLPFTTNEGTNYRVEYGYGNYNQTLDGTGDWGTSHTAVLSNLTLGTTVQYRIIAMNHRNDPAATPGQAVITGTYAIVEPPPPTTATVTITANPAASRPISPWIYGINNWEGGPSEPIRNIPFTRHGGNRATAFNWENNASNAGSDWWYVNSGDASIFTIPCEGPRRTVVSDRANGMANLTTVQMLGYVSADINGDNVTWDSVHSVSIPIPTVRATRFKQVVFKKSSITGTPFTTSPDPNDAYVYMDEFLWALDRKVTGSTAGGTATQIYTDPNVPTFIGLDNEPDLWGHTHAEVQGWEVMPPPDEYIQKAINLSKAVKDLIPGSKVFGPGNYGYYGLISWRGDPAFSTDYWFAERYLAELKAASITAGHRLVDVYNFHWYSEIRSGEDRITDLDGAVLTNNQVQAIVQAPRSLWDPTFVEYSPVANYFGGQAARIVDRLQAKIAAIWPGTDIAITEYDTGGGRHIAGVIAQADNLGIFGQRGLFAASLWPWPNRVIDSQKAAFKLYRDYDGNLGEFGDISIPTVSSDTSKVAAYLSRDSANPNRQVIVALNRSSAPQAVAFTGANLSGTARIFRMSAGTGTTPVLIGTATVDANWLLALPPYCVATVEIIGGAPAANYASWRTTAFGASAGNDAIAGPNADPDGAGLTNFARYAFSLAARGPVAAPTTPGTTTAGGQSYLTIAFNRRAAGSDLSYVVEGSSDLVTWTPVPGRTYGPGATAITAQDSVAIGTAGVTRRFLRVHLAAP